MSRSSSLTALLSAPLLFLAPVAFAQAPQESGGACKADVERLCPGAQPGHGRVMRCLRDKEDQVSAECKAHIEEMRQRFQAAAEACKPDVEKFCQDVQPGGGRIIQCLRQHETELSDACKAQHHH
jgi:Cysteine rich repeat